MSSSTSSPAEADGDAFTQQSASAWIVFDPAQAGGHRRDVRSAAAKSSASARKATIARKLALNTNCTSSEDGTDGVQKSGPVMKRRRKASQGYSPKSATSPMVFSPRTQSETSLVSMIANSRTYTSGAGPTGMKDSRAPVAVSAPVSPVSVKQNYTQPLSNNSGNPHNHEAWQAASFVLGLENHFAADDNIPNPTQFGALRIKTMTIENVHNAISTGQASPGTLLAVALLAAWGRRFGDERYCLLHIRAWYALARRRGMLLPQDNSDTVNLSVPQVVLLSLQAFFNLDHVLDDTAASNSFARACFTTSTPTGRQIVHFFDLLGQLISSNGNT